MHEQHMTDEQILAALADPDTEWALTPAGVEAVLAAIAQAQAEAEAADDRCEGCGRRVCGCPPYTDADAKEADDETTAPSAVAAVPDEPPASSLGRYRAQVVGFLQEADLTDAGLAAVAKRGRPRIDEGFRAAEPPRQVAAAVVAAVRREDEERAEAAARSADAERRGAAGECPAEMPALAEDGSCRLGDLPEGTLFRGVADGRPVDQPEGTGRVDGRLLAPGSVTKHRVRVAYLGPDGSEVTGDFGVSPDAVVRPLTAELAAAVSRTHEEARATLVLWGARAGQCGDQRTVAVGSLPEGAFARSADRRVLIRRLADEGDGVRYAVVVDGAERVAERTLPPTAPVLPLADREAAYEEARVAARATKAAQAPRQSKRTASTTHAAAAVAGRDPRLPAPGTVITAGPYKGQRWQVTILAAGCEVDGKVFSSLSGAAKASTGQGLNGFAWANLVTRAGGERKERKERKPAAERPAHTTKRAPKAEGRDPRLPAAGTVLMAKTGQSVTVLDAGIEVGGVVYRSLSGAAKATTGKNWNGYIWAGLAAR